MTHDDSKEGLEAKMDGLLSIIESEAARVNVEWDVAASQLRALALPGGRACDSDDATEMLLGLDATKLLGVLQQLPSGAGTSAFVDAMSASH